MRMHSFLLVFILTLTACSSITPKRDVSSVLDAESLELESFAVDDDDADDASLSQKDGVRESLWARWFDKKVGIFNNPDYPAYDLLKGAKKTIDIEIYEMKDPKFRELLVAALKRGVKVRIVKDSNTVADSCDELSEIKTSDKADCVEEKKYIQKILSLNASYVYFNKKKLCADEGKTGCFQHGKMIIADNRYLLLSTGNFNTSSFCDLDSKPSKCNRDYSYVTKNKKVIAFLKGVMDQDITRERWSMKSGIAQGHKAVTVSPFSRPRLIALIRSAQKSVSLQNQYLEDPEINQALIEKRQGRC